MMWGHGVLYVQAAEDKPDGDQHHLEQAVIGMRDARMRYGHAGKR